MGSDVEKDDSLETKPAKAKRRVDWKTWVFLGMILVGLYTWLSNRGPKPPRIDTTDLDPAVATVLQNCERIVWRNRRSSSAWGQYGMACLVYDYKAEARECFEHAATFDPADPRWPYFQGVASLPDNTEEAVGYLRRAVALNPDENHAPRIRLANILADQGEFDEAEKIFQAVITDEPRDPHAVLGLARLDFAQNNFSDCLATLDSIKNSPFTARAVANLAAAAYTKLQKPELAKDAREQLRRLPQDRPMPDPYVEQAAKLRVGLEAMVNFGSKLLREGRLVDAKPLAKKAVAYYPKEAEAWMFMARVDLGEKNLELALDAAHKAVDLAPDNVEAHVQLGAILLVHGDTDEAIESFQAAKALDSNHSEIHHNLGLSYFAKSDWSKAITSFREAIRLNVRLLDAHLKLIESLLKSGDKAGARKAVDEALVAFPTQSAFVRLKQQLAAPGETPNSIRELSEPEQGESPPVVSPDPTPEDSADPLENVTGADD